MVNTSLKTIKNILLSTLKVFLKTNKVLKPNVGESCSNFSIDTLQTCWSNANNIIIFFSNK